MHLKIDTVVKGPHEYNPPDKDYTIWSWICDGQLAGDFVSDITVKTFSARMKDEIKDGWSGEAEESEFKGNKEYVIRAPKGGFGGGKSGGWKPRTPSYTVDEYDALYKHACDMAADAMTAIVTKDVSDDAMADVTSRLMSTYMISATQAGVKVSGSAGSGTDSSDLDFPPNDVRPEIEQALKDARLWDRWTASNISSDDLDTWWVECDGAKNMFAKRVNSELRKVE